MADKRHCMRVERHVLLDWAQKHYGKTPFDAAQSIRLMYGRKQGTVILEQQANALWHASLFDRHGGKLPFIGEGVTQSEAIVQLEYAHYTAIVGRAIVNFERYGVLPFG